MPISDTAGTAGGISLIFHEDLPELEEFRTLLLKFSNQEDIEKIRRRLPFQIERHFADQILQTVKCADTPGAWIEQSPPMG